MATMLYESLTNAWDYTFATYDESTVMWLGTFIIHELAYFGCSFFYWVLERIPFFDQWKMQADKPASQAQYWNCLKKTLFSHVVFQLPMMVIFAPTMLRWLDMSVSTPFPSWRTMALSCFGCAIVEDVYFYFIHRLLHHPKIYKSIHKVHHEYAAPFGMAAEYAHPIETIFLGVGTMLGPVFFIRHLGTLWVWLIYRLLQTVECHSGYDFPFSPNRWLPLFGGAEYHDYHHRTFLGPYSSTFTFMDTLFGTSKHYWAEHQKKSEVKK